VLQRFQKDTTSSCIKQEKEMSSECDSEDEGLPQKIVAIPYNPAYAKKEEQLFDCAQEIHSDLQKYIHDCGLSIFNDEESLLNTYYYLHSFGM
jgi:hypothetical protein